MIQNWRFVNYWCITDIELINETSECVAPHLQSLMLYQWTASCLRNCAISNVVKWAESFPKQSACIYLHRKMGIHCTAYSWRCALYSTSVLCIYITMSFYMWLCCHFTVTYCVKTVKHKFTQSLLRREKFNISHLTSSISPLMRLRISSRLWAEQNINWITISTIEI